MRELAIEYADYHRTVLAFHGTTLEAAEQLVAGVPFRESDNEDNWFGKGIYFWEYAPKQAWWWARKYKKYQAPAVIGTIIRLGNCFDLLDPGNVKTLRAFHDEMKTRLKRTRAEMPANVRHRRNLDCSVFNYLYRRLENQGKALDSARAVYVPTKARKRVWEGSWIYEEAHIQICVRNPKNILAVWHVRPDGRYGKWPSEQG